MVWIVLIMSSEIVDGRWTILRWPKDSLLPPTLPASSTFVPCFSLNLVDAFR